jgi:hypothetical protein
MHTYLEPDKEKLQRVWHKWAVAHKDNDFESREEAHKAFIDEQAKITETLLEEYLKIEPYARPIPLADRPDDSIMKPSGACARCDDQYQGQGRMG